jgi:hypothetical protein
MFQKLGEAISLLFSNIVLFTLIILTVWLPGNILINLYVYYASSPDFWNLIRLSMFFEGIFGPIYIGAMVYVLFQIKQNRKVSYKESISVGFKNWGRLFVARWIAGIIIMLGFIALIIPGIILTIRYAVLDSAVILEGASSSQARSRSVELTKGMRWKIFGILLLFLVIYIVVSFVVYIPLDFFDHIILSVSLDCILDVIYGISVIILFLIYWEAKSKEPITTESQIVCQKCGLENWAGYDVCQNCGARLK